MNHKFVRGQLVELIPLEKLQDQGLDSTVRLFTNRLYKIVRFSSLSTTYEVIEVCSQRGPFYFPEEILCKPSSLEKYRKKS